MRIPSTEAFQNYYWVEPRKLLAGSYPMASHHNELRLKLRHLVDLGVSLFIDLTEEGEKGLTSYSEILAEEEVRQGAVVDYQRIPIADFNIPTKNTMKRILGMIDTSMSMQKTVYIHCFAGIGRTGTVVGCYLVKKGLTGDEALLTLNHLHQGTYFEGSISVLTIEQRTVIRNWNSVDNL